MAVQQVGQYINQFGELVPVYADLFEYNSVIGSWADVSNMGYAYLNEHYGKLYSQGTPEAQAYANDTIQRAIKHYEEAWQRGVPRDRALTEAMNDQVKYWGEVYAQILTTGKPSLIDLNAWIDTIWLGEPFKSWRIQDTVIQPTGTIGTNNWVIRAREVYTASIKSGMTAQQSYEAGQTQFIKEAQKWIDGEPARAEAYNSAASSNFKVVATTLGIVVGVVAIAFPVAGAIAGAGLTAGLTETAPELAPDKVDPKVYDAVSQVVLDTQIENQKSTLAATAANGVLPTLAEKLNLPKTPAALGAIAIGLVAAIGYGGYKLYKYLSSKV